MNFIEAIANHQKAVMELVDAQRCEDQAQSTLNLMVQRHIQAQRKLEVAVHIMNEAAKEMFTK